MRYGEPHKLTVYEVPEESPTDYHITEFQDYEVEHPSTCKLVPDEVYGGERYECELAWNLEQVGLRWSLHYSGTPIKVTGEYMIRGWSDTIRGFDFVEHDGGIGLMSVRDWVAYWGATLRAPASTD